MRINKQKIISKQNCCFVKDNLTKQQFFVAKHATKRSGGPFFNCREAEIADISEKREQKRYINKKLYQTLVKRPEKEHGMGEYDRCRPTKMIMERLEEGSSEEEIIRYMHDTYVVSEKKAMLGIEIAKREKAQLDKLDYENGYSLYIGIRSARQPAVTAPLLLIRLQNGRTGWMNM